MKIHRAVSKLAHFIHFDCMYVVITTLLVRPGGLVWVIVMFKIIPILSAARTQHHMLHMLLETPRRHQLGSGKNSNQTYR